MLALIQGRRHKKQNTIALFLHEALRGSGSQLQCRESGWVEVRRP